jgi:arylsulfatase A-like enzyme
LPTIKPAKKINIDKEDRPNVILIVSDNLGAWQLGCYGNSDIYSPNIDRLADEGMRFTRAMSCNPVCSPTRASILTGMIPSQHGVHHWLLDGNHQVGPKAKCVISEFETIPEILSEAGYFCGLVGKWHLGDNMNPQEGFEYWVTMPSGLTRNFYGVEVVDNGKIKVIPGYILEFWTERAVNFLEKANSRRKNTGQPFYLHLTYNGPYSLDPELLLDSKRSGNKFLSRYENMPMESFPRQEPHKGLFKHIHELNNVMAMRTSAAQISGVDEGVGGIMSALKELGLIENTIVIFTADQGTAGGYNGIWGMGHNTKPSVAYDKVMQVPMIVYHDKQIKPGQTSDKLVNNYDLLPFIVDYIGFGDNIPENLPGRSFAKIVRGEEIYWEDVTFFEHFYTRAIRTDKWKYVWRYKQDADLFDLEKDPAEEKNLATDPAYADVIKKLKVRLDSFYGKYTNKKYDIINGGKSKSWHPPFVEPDFVPVENKTRYYRY